MGVRALHRRRRGRTPPSLPGVEWVEGDLADEQALRTLVDRYGCGHSLCRDRARRAARRISSGSTPRARPALVRAAAGLPPGAAIPADVLAGGADAATVGLRREQAARRGRGGGRPGEPALDGAATARGLRPGRSRAPAALSLGARAASRRCLPDGGGRFSLLYVDDLASAVRALARGRRGATAAASSSMTGIAGGYDWDTVLAVAGARAARGALRAPLAHSRRRCSGLRPSANLAAARLLRLRPDAHAGQGARDHASGLVVR